ncbi:MAG: RluA family pseudouridine synthase [Pyrinomonadaceae bacterium]|nr:RluA family pseudouridine synthase [Pyrinomonadaceae bacterium]MCX7639524.1 RluA family pseudouridine synthase [Pyrinomonadaceae bacterium]MDW8304425.1 RluA family pseudouridine synthase [Acidobacteriota bacterium]
MKQIFRFVVDEDFHRRRLDEFIYAKFPLISRIYLRRRIRDGKCEVNGEVVNRGYILSKNDFVEIEIEVDEENDFQPEPMDLDILFEDEDLLVINKPAGMIVHPTKQIRSGTLLNGLAYYFASRGSRLLRAGLVHRLDKETSGLMVIAKNPEALRTLAGDFQKKRVEKRYFALVDGLLSEKEGKIDAPIGKLGENHFWGVRKDGKPSVTNFWVVKRLYDATLLELEPVTGRTNQLRVHLSYIGHPIIGDEKYGGRKFHRLCLHSCKVAFPHPRTRQVMVFQTDVPEDFYTELLFSQTAERC